LVELVALFRVSEAVVKRDCRGYELSESVKPYVNAGFVAGTLAH